MDFERIYHAALDRALRGGDQEESGAEEQRQLDCQ